MTLLVARRRPPFPIGCLRPYAYGVGETNMAARGNMLLSFPPPPSSETGERQKEKWRERRRRRRRRKKTTLPVPSNSRRFPLPEEGFFRRRRRVHTIIECRPASWASHFQFKLAVETNTDTVAAPVESERVLGSFQVCK